MTRRSRLEQCAMLLCVSIFLYGIWSGNFVLVLMGMLLPACYVPAFGTWLIANIAIREFRDASALRRAGLIFFGIVFFVVAWSPLFLMFWNMPILP